ncbi:hypothetical protein JXA85_06325 [Candidatus Woesearchaeota archaeon]|nr:hypothetical protein [Candidatus Woesearchaeota archaeon]
MIEIVASWLGLFLGAFLGTINSIQVELKPGNRYFRFLQRAIIAAILVLLVFFNFNNALLVIFIVLFFISFFLKKEKTISQFHYLLFGILAFFVYKTNQSPLFLSLIFLHGFPTGTLFAYEEKEKRRLKLFLLLFTEYLHYLILALGLIALFR